MYKTSYRSVYASMLKFGTTSHTDLIQDVWCFLTDVLYKSQRLIKMGLILVYYFMAFFSCTFLLGEQRQYQLIPTKACSSVSQNFLENWGRLELLPSNFSDKFCSFGVPYRFIFACFSFSLNPICKPMLRHHLLVYFGSVLLDINFCSSILLFPSTASPASPDPIPTTCPRWTPRPQQWPLNSRS